MRSIQSWRSVTQTPSARFLSILQTLAEYSVEFILVGGVAGVIHGAPVTTFDVDIVHRRTSSNIAKLLAALTHLDASYRHAGGRQLRPSESHLTGPGHQLLMTRLGPLDVLGMIGANHAYEDLIGDAELMQLAPDLSVQVISLPLLIQTKVEVGQPKDQAILDILRETLRSKQQSL